MADYVLIDETGGAATSGGQVWSQETLAIAARVLEIYLNTCVAPEWGGAHSVRVGSSPTDVHAGERVHSYRNGLPDAPGAIAYHDKDGNGVPYSLQDITLTPDLFGPQGATAATSHELAEATGDPGCNRYAKDGKGKQVALELCDAVEVQSFPIEDNESGTQVYVSNFLFQAFFDAGAPGPYDYISSVEPNPSAPPGPMQTAPGDGGNYQIIDDEGQNETTVTATLSAKIDELRKAGDEAWRELLQALRLVEQHVKPASHAPRGPHIVGTPARASQRAHWSSRTYRRTHPAG